MTAGGAAALVWLPPPGRWQLSRPQLLRLLPPLVWFLGLRTASVLAGLDRPDHPYERPFGQGCRQLSRAPVGMPS
jgi:hypothetical protein